MSFPLPSEVFADVQVPQNIVQANALENRRLWRWAKGIHRRVHRRLQSGDGSNHVGSFRYLRENRKHPVRFNGRNAQFHALYDPYYKGGYEAETAYLLLRLARGDGAFYDIGANWGYFSLLLAASPRFKGAIYSFEPNPTTFADLRQTLDDAGLAARVTAVQAGIGHEAGELRIAETDPFLSGLARLDAQGTGAKVPVHPIDQLDYTSPEIVKIDAEGMELAVLQGATRTLREKCPHIIFESFRRFDDPQITRAPLEFLLERDYCLFNPALAFSSSSGPVLAGYDVPLGELLAREPRPPTALIPVNPVNRFVMAHQLNIWACHRSRLSDLLPGEFVEIKGL